MNNVILSILYFDFLYEIKTTKQNLYQ